MNYLITGGAGFIGSNIVKKLLENNDCKVFVVDDLSTGINNLEKVQNDRLFFYKNDIRDEYFMKKVFSLCNPNIVIHAACRSVVRGEESPFEDISVNALGTLRMLKLSDEFNVTKFIYCSSASIYGDMSSKEYLTEGCLPCPSSHYAISKLSGEYYTKLYGQRKMKTMSLRYFNVYGPGQNRDSIYGGVVPIFINNCLTGSDLLIYGNGDQTRDFTFIDDVVKATLFVATNECDQPVLNIGSGINTTIVHLAKVVKDLSGKSSNIKFVKNRIIDNVKHRKASIALAEKSIGYKDLTKLETGIKRTIADIMEKIS
jgi:UDP-glucose 4-epimerase